MSQLLALFILVFAAGCQTKPFKQTLLSDGKTWQISYKFKAACAGKSDFDCGLFAKREIGVVARETCNSGNYRLFQTDVSPRIGKATTYMRCERAP